MFASLPETTAAFLQLTWPEIEHFYRDLEQRPLTADTLDDWMADWGRLGKLLDEAYWRLWVDTTLDTTDTARESRFHDFLTHIREPAEAAEQKLRRKLLASGLEPRQFAMPLRNMQAEVDLFRAENLPLLTEEKRLTGEDDRIRSLQTVTWAGEERSVVEMAAVYLDTDRAKREQAWRLVAERILQDRAARNHLWRDFMALRGQLAANAGQPDYLAYGWQQLLRLDYTPADCVTFHDAIEAVAVPAAARIYEKRRRLLGVDTLRPWDVDCDPLGRPPLRPFQTIDELERKAETIFRRVDPVLGDRFQAMRHEGLLDLDSRRGKMSSAYCASFPVQKRPFVLMNAIGTEEDVMTLIHESGHAFHTFENVVLPYHQQLQIGTEFHEVASMTMELLAAPYLSEAEGGFYSSADTRRARIEHLESLILFWPYMAVVDAFQHWAYTHHAAASDPANCDAAWGDLWAHFMVGVDWSGFEDFRVTGWQRKLHIFQNPLYYVDYGLAASGAVQIWRHARNDQAGAIRKYRAALALGGTVSLPELYAAAGAKLAFDRDTLRESVDFITATIETLEQESLS
ncbi:MAG: M3 family oligoendopeptidase [Anaerolineae bacterium]|nr:M3 family oligoendopeptidase [Anaerolineae bacterium]